MHSVNQLKLLSRFPRALLGMQYDCILIYFVDEMISFEKLSLSSTIEKKIILIFFHLPPFKSDQFFALLEFFLIFQTLSSTKFSILPDIFFHLS